MNHTQSDCKDGGKENVPDLDTIYVEDWTAADVELWLMENGFKEEAPLFLAQQITGKVLAQLDRATLKDVGISIIGRQLELLQKIKSLCGKEESKSTSNIPCSSTKTKQWKSKITLEDKKQWTPELKARYNTRTGIVIREATKIWNGNEKVYFKNERTKLQLEELATKLVDMCSIPEIGFGYDAIRAHIIQWGQEKNRRITNGYDYEVEHTPAKRAKVSSTHKVPSTSCQDSSDSDTEHDDQVSTSTSPEDLSPHSARVATLVEFNASCLQDVGVKTHLAPLAKKLGVKHRSLGKREMLFPLAKELFAQGYLHVQSPMVNYKRLKRAEITVRKLVCNASPQPSEFSDSSEDISEASDLQQ